MYRPMLSAPNLHTPHFFFFLLCEVKPFFFNFRDVTRIVRYCLQGKLKYSFLLSVRTGISVHACCLVIESHSGTLLVCHYFKQCYCFQAVYTHIRARRARMFRSTLQLRDTVTSFESIIRGKSILC